MFDYVVNQVTKFALVLGGSAPLVLATVVLTFMLLFM